MSNGRLPQNLRFTEKNRWCFLDRLYYQPVEFMQQGIRIIGSTDVRRSVISIESTPLTTANAINLPGAPISAEATKRIH